MPPGMKGILCIKFDLFKIKNTDFWAAYDLAGSFKLCIVVFLDVSPLQTCVSLKFTDKNFEQPNCF